MSKWTLFVSTLLFSLTIFGSIGCSNKKYEEAKGLSQNGNQLRTDLSTNLPEPTWTDAQLDEYGRKIDEYQGSIDRLNNINGKDGVEVHGTEDAGKAVAAFRARLQEARRLKGALGPVNGSDNPEIVRYNQLEQDNDKIFKDLPRPEKGKGMQDLALSQLKKWNTAVEKILKNLEEQVQIANRNKLITQDKKDMLGNQVTAFTNLREGVKKLMADKVPQKQRRQRQLKTPRTDRCLSSKIYLRYRCKPFGRRKTASPNRIRRYTRRRCH